jgi:hypothetical protein
LQLFSIGSLYIGTDNASFNEAFIHIGKLRIELGSPRNNKDDGTNKQSNGLTPGEMFSGNEEDTLS